jgi:hypothetical protein
MKMDTLDRAAARGRSLSLYRSLFITQLTAQVAGPAAPGSPLANFWPPSGALTNTNKPWPAPHPPCHNPSGCSGCRRTSASQ